MFKIAIVLYLLQIYSETSVFCSHFQLAKVAY